MMPEPPPYSFLADSLGRLLALGDDRSHALVRNVAQKLVEGLAEGHTCLFPEDVSPEAHALAGHPAIDGNAGREAPIVYRCGRFYLRRHYRDEQDIAHTLAALRPPSDRPAVASNAPPLERLHQSLSTGGIAIVLGGPGTGKTTLATQYLERFLRDRSDASAPDHAASVAVCAPTGKAAGRFEEALRQRAPHILPHISVGTLHRLLGISRTGRPRCDANHPLLFSLVVVDEASMIDLRLMAQLCRAIDPRRTRLLLLGDADQLASVQAGAVLAEIQAAAKASPGWRPALMELTVNHRFSADSGIHNLCQAIRKGDAERALAILQSKEYPDVVLEPHADPLAIARQAAERFDALTRCQQPREALEAAPRYRLLSALRQGPEGSDALSRQTRQYLPPTAPLPIIIDENRRDLDLYNGNTGLIMTDPEDPDASSWAWFEGDGTTALRFFAPGRLPRHSLAHALTIHRTQGSEYEHIDMVLPPAGHQLLHRELLYTGVSRARQSVRIFCDSDTLRIAIGRPMLRRSGLAKTIFEKSDIQNPG